MSSCLAAEALWLAPVRAVAEGPGIGADAASVTAVTAAAAAAEAGAGAASVRVVAVAGTCTCPAAPSTRGGTAAVAFKREGSCSTVDSATATPAGVTSAPRKRRAAVGCGTAAALDLVGVVLAEAGDDEATGDRGGLTEARLAGWLAVVVCARAFAEAIGTAMRAPGVTRAAAWTGAATRELGALLPKAAVLGRGGWGFGAAVGRELAARAGDDATGRGAPAGCSAAPDAASKVVCMGRGRGRQESGRGHRRQELQHRNKHREGGAPPWPVRWRSRGH